MPDQLDARIRAMVREVVDSSPPVPRFEEIEAGLAVPVVRQGAARQRVTRRTRVVVAIAACVAIALVIGGVVLVARNDSPSVKTPAVPPTAAVTKACAGKAYVNNQGDNTVSVITTATGAVSAPITVGANPGGLAVTPDGTHVYVANPGDSKAAGTVSVIDTKTGVVSATIAVGAGPGIVEITPDGTHAYVLNSTDSTVSVIDTATGVVSATIPVGRGPLGLAFTPDGAHAYVANYFEGTVSVIDTATGVVSATIPVGTGALGVAVTPDGKHVYVSNQNDNTVSVITTATGAVSAPIPVGAKPSGVAISPDGKHVYVAENGSGLLNTGAPGNTVSVIDTATGVVSNTITVGSGPVGAGVHF